MRRRLAVVAVVAAALALLAGCNPVAVARGIAGRWKQDITALPFYDVPDPLPAGAPGKVIKIQPMTAPPKGSHAWRVMYHSRDLHGADIAVTGLVIAPNGPAPAGGRPIVSWAHPTTGASVSCAPSLTLGATAFIDGVDGFIRAGDVVVATDYPGLGAAGPSSYLLGVSEADSVLDIARAARTMSGVGAGTKLLLWGHSQGGHAVLFAGQEVGSYAPELQLQAVAVAAPATNLGELLRDDIVDVSGVTIGSYAFAAYQPAYAAQYPGLSLDSILTPAGVAATPGMSQLCLLSQTKALHDQARPLIGGYLAADPQTTQPWATMLQENSPGASRIGVPILVAQGLKDTLVKPAVTEGYVKQLCASGEHVDFLRFPNDTHGLIGFAATSDVQKMFAAVLAGASVPNSCSIG